jgi:hypothetical protein
VCVCVCVCMVWAYIMLLCVCVRLSLCVCAHIMLQHHNMQHVFSISHHVCACTCIHGMTRSARNLCAARAGGLPASRAAGHGQPWGTARRPRGAHRGRDSGYERRVRTYERAKCTHACMSVFGDSSHVSKGL